MASYFGGFVGGDAVAPLPFGDEEMRPVGRMIQTSSGTVACGGEVVPPRRTIEDLDPFGQGWGLDEPKPTTDPK